MRRILVSITILLAAVSAASAQEFTTSYFLDNNSYSYRINPAIPSEKGFVGLIINNVNLSIGSNTGIKSLLYPSENGRLVTGFHSSISPEQFLGNLPSNIRLDQVFNENLLAVGFWTENAFHNIEFNVKEDIFAGLPKDLFAMFKIGTRDLPYDLSQTNISAKSYAELAYGYSRKIGDKLAVGGRVKLLMGLVAANGGVERGDFMVNGDQISYDARIKFRLSSNFVSGGISVEDPRLFDFSVFNLDPSSITPCGWGGAIDLGATYKPIEDLTVSASIIDLGGIGWKYNIVGVSSGSDTYTGETIKSDGTVKGDLEAFAKNLEKLGEFERVEGGESSFEMLACTIHLGARYKMPFYKRLSAGLLATTRIDKYNPSFGCRLGATVTPVDWFSFTANYGISTYCKSYGLALSLNAAFLNFIVGYEGYSGYTSQVKVSDILSPLATPLGSFQNMLKFGVTINFGQRHKE